MTDALTDTGTAAATAATAASDSVMSVAPRPGTAAQTRTDATMSNQVMTHARATLAAAVLGFFIITLDAVVVNVALPSIRHDFGGGVSGMQWVVDGYTLMFASLFHAAAQAMEDRYGKDNVGPWDDWTWGFVNGKLAAALRWVLGSEWDFLDT
jgi:hypothetical protein